MQIENNRLKEEAEVAKFELTNKVGFGLRLRLRLRIRLWYIR